MREKYFKKIAGLVFATLMLLGVGFVSSTAVQAQGRRTIVVVRPNRRHFYGPFGYRSWWNYPYGYNSWGYYGQYVFGNSEAAVNQGYQDGFKTGKDDGKKAKSFNPERSHYYHDAGFGNYAEVYRSGFSRGYQEGYGVGENQRAG